MNIRFTCEHCGQKYECEAGYAGTELECSHCNNVFIVPEQSTIPPKNPVEPATPHVEPTQELALPTIDPPKQKLQIKKKETAPEQENSEIESSEDYGKCPSCGAALRMKEAVICTECGHNLRMGLNVNTVAKAKKAGKFGLSIGVAAAAAIVSGLIWAGIVIATGFQIGWVAWFIGLVTGAAICLVTPERSPRVGLIAAGLAICGLLIGKMVTAEYYIGKAFKPVMTQLKKMTDPDKVDKMLLSGVLYEEMKEKGEIHDPMEKLNKLKPKSGEKPSAAYLQAQKQAFKESIAAQKRVQQRLKTLSAADEKRLRKKFGRAMLQGILYKEMLENGEVEDPFEKIKKLAPKAGENFSPEYKAALNKASEEHTTVMKKVKEKLKSLTPEDEKRLKSKMFDGSTYGISYFQKLKMIFSAWDILWFLLAISTAWGFGTGASGFNRH